MSKFLGFVIGAVEIGVGIALLPTGTGLALIVSGAMMIASSAAQLLLTPKISNSRQAAALTLQLGEVPRVAIFGETAACAAFVE